MSRKPDHTATEARLWKALNFTKRLIGWAVLIVSALLTIYLGFQGILLVANGIRDWWHYVERSPDPGLGVYFLLFFGSGFAWMLSYHYLADPKTDEVKFQEYIRQKRAETARWEKERTRERTRWERVKDKIALAYVAVVAIGAAAAIIKKTM